MPVRIGLQVPLVEVEDNVDEVAHPPLFPRYPHLAALGFLRSRQYGGVAAILRKQVHGGDVREGVGGQRGRPSLDIRPHPGNPSVSYVRNSPTAHPDSDSDGLGRDGRSGGTLPGFHGHAIHCSGKPRLSRVLVLLIGSAGPEAGPLIGRAMLIESPARNVWDRGMRDSERTVMLCRMEHGCKDVIHVEFGVASNVDDPTQDSFPWGTDPS